MPYWYADYDDAESDHLTADDLAGIDRSAKRTRTLPRPATGQPRKPRLRSPRTEDDQAFKCGHCRQFIGAPIAGGRHRNHCPNCLYSKHVDHKMPGDRRSECHSMMAPIGLLSRRNGEQVLIHLCLGCGKEDPNRIAADDNPLLLMRIEPVTAPAMGEVTDEVEDIA
ncbi:MAG: Ribosome small subunit-stimulated GTPase EngC [uncultured Thermomicrobiales bacterium]|uniref:Ribosome small subunit-stimulated GTPase EngC n=1 Tax=uncultured Thermomicrobiales bacterium TaxID=1645740 RepID=A0A6J4U7A5_9BACT|nr:MAG: Ribosome small subunit-stimulated GTPase EngC [uncultured Thermomicrobiales bacterium]